MEGLLLRRYSGGIKAVLRRYSGGIQAVLRRYQGSVWSAMKAIKALLRLNEGSNTGADPNFSTLVFTPFMHAAAKVLSLLALLVQKYKY